MNEDDSREVARRKHIKEMIAAMNSVEMDFAGSGKSLRYGGGRDLNKLVYAAELAEP